MSVQSFEVPHHAHETALVQPVDLEQIPVVTCGRKLGTSGGVHVRTDDLTGIIMIESIEGHSYLVS